MRKLYEMKISWKAEIPVKYVEGRGKILDKFEGTVQLTFFFVLVYSDYFPYFLQKQKNKKYIKKISLN